MTKWGDDENNGMSWELFVHKIISHYASLWYLESNNQQKPSAIDPVVYFYPNRK